MKIETIDFITFNKMLANSYINDFSKNERVPLRMLKCMYNKGNIYFQVLKDEEGIYAYAIFLTDVKKEYTLLWYFATLKDYRKKGYGTIFLNEIKKNMKDTKLIIIEVERRGLGKNNIENEIREKRVEFYVKNNFKQTNLNVNVYKIEVEILCVFNTDKKISKEELFNVYLKLYYTIRKKETVDRNIYKSKL